MQKIILACGKYQYGVPERGLGTEFVSFVPALESLGYEVLVFDVLQKDLYRDYAEMNQSLLELCIRERPAILLSVQLQYEIWRETLDILRNHLGMGALLWSTDDSFKYHTFSKPMSHWFDWIITTYPFRLSDYQADGIKNVLLSQWATEEKNLIAPKSFSECRYDVSFVGASHGNRKAMIQELSNLGIKVECFGHGWTNGPVEADAVFSIMNNSKVTLNFSNSSGVNQIKARVFEATGAGACLVSEGADGLENFLDPEEEVVLYRSPPECAKQIKKLLAYPELRDKIANRAYQRTSLEHTYQKRFTKILDRASISRSDFRPDLAVTQMENLVQMHRNSCWYDFFAPVLGQILNIPFGQPRGFRAARRFYFEVLSRLNPAHTYSVNGFLGRNFYEYS